MASSDGGMMTFYIEEITDEAEDGVESPPDPSKTAEAEADDDDSVEAGAGGSQSASSKKKKKKRGKKKKGAKAAGSESTSAEGLRWEPMTSTSTAPPGRGGGSLTQVGGSLLLFGGADRVQRHFGEMHRFDLATGSWSVLPSADQPTAKPPCARSGHSAVLLADGRGVVVFGGINFTDETVHNDTHLFDTEAGVWCPVSIKPGSPLPPARNSHTATALPTPSEATSSSVQRVVVYGGSSPEDGPLGDVWVLRLQGEYGPDGMWTAEWWTAPVDGQGPGAREMHAVCLLPAPAVTEGEGGVVVAVMGGRREDGRVERDLWTLDTGSWRWRQLSSSCPTPRCAHALFTSTNKGVKLWVLGGFDGVAEVFDDCAAFDTASGTWSGRQPLTGQEEDAKPRFGMAAAAKPDGSGAYVFGGVNVMEDLNDLVHIMA